MFSQNSWFSIGSPQKLIALAAIVKWTFICRSFLIGRPKAKSPTRSGSGAKGSENWPVEQNHRIAIPELGLRFSAWSFSHWINLDLLGFKAIPVVFPPLDFKAMCRCAMPAPADRAVEALTDSSAKLTAFVMSLVSRQGVNGAKWRKMVKSSRCLDPHSDSNLMRAPQPDLLNVSC